MVPCRGRVKDRRPLRGRHQTRGALRNPERIGHSEDHSFSTRPLCSSGATFSKGLAIASQFPVTLQFRIVQIDPFPHQPQGCPSNAIAQENIPAEIDLHLVALILGMDVGRRIRYKSDSAMSSSLRKSP
jgi:hypothetical protein